MKKLVSLLLALLIMVQPINLCVTKAVENNAITQAYENKLVPADGKTLVFIGQDDDEVADYIQATGMVPAGMMLYTNLSDLSAMTTAYQGTGANQSGKMDFQRWTSEYDNTVLNLAIWASSTSILNGIINGDYDDNIKKLASYMKSSDKPIYVRFGYEFDGPWNAYSPQLYNRAYKHFVDVIRDTTIEGEYHYGAGDNVTFVWHSAAFFRLGDNNIWPGINYDASSVESYLTNPTYTLEDWYPGDEYVDWVGMSWFAWEHEFQENAASIRRDEVVAFAKEHNKPIMIAESAPKEIWQPNNPTKGCGDNGKVCDICQSTTNHEGNSWDNWYQPIFNYIEDNDIKAFCYINQDWNAQEMWRLEGGWGDSRLQGNEEILSKWLTKLKEDRYLLSSAMLYAQINYQPKNQLQNLEEGINVLEYSAKADNGDSWGIKEYEDYIGFNGQYTWVEYNLKITKPGYYKVIYDYVSGIAKGTNINVLVNGIQQDTTVTLPLTDANWTINKKVEGQTVNFEYAGNYTILFQSPSAGVNLKNITFQETTPSNPTRMIFLHGKDDLSGESQNITVSYGAFASFGAPSKAVYYFDVDKEGEYIITYNYGTTINSKYKSYVDQKMIEDSLMTATGDWTRWKNAQGATVYLTTGKHNITVESPNGSLNLQYIEIKLKEESEEIPTQEEITTSEKITTTAQDETTSCSIQRVKKVSVRTLRIKKQKKKIKIKWKKLSNVTGYQIQYAKNKKFTEKVKRIIIKRTNKTIKNIKVNKNIRFVRVRGYIKKQGIKIYGPYSKIIKVK